MKFSIQILNDRLLRHIKLHIIDTDEVKDDTSIFKYFVYTIKVVRNDGLEWFVKKRYKELRDLKDSLERNEIDVNFSYRF